MNVWSGLSDKYSKYSTLWSETTICRNSSATRGMEYGRQVLKLKTYLTSVYNRHTMNSSGFQIMVENHQLRPLATRGPQFGQRDQTLNHFWRTHPRIKWIELSVFLKMVGNHTLWQFFRPLGTEIWRMWPKIKPLLNSKLNSAYTTHEVGWMASIPDNRLKLPIATIGWLWVKFWSTWPGKCIKCSKRWKSGCFQEDDCFSVNFTTFKWNPMTYCSNGVTERETDIRMRGHGVFLNFLNRAKGEPYVVKHTCGQ